MLKKSFFKNLILILVGFFTVFSFIPKINIAHAANNNIGVTFGTDKANVKPGDTFSIIIDVKNTGSSGINNVEVRVPFLKTISDASYQIESPSFNKVLDTNEYPSGFNSRSWIINRLDPDETQSFSIKYTVSADPKTPNGLVSSYNLPITWVDPAGAQSNTLVNVKTFRADIYVNKSYSTSYTANLPKLDSLDNQVALVTLNSKYLYSGTKTTNLKTITSTNIASFPNFVLDTQDVTMEWLSPIDFSGAQSAQQLGNLDTSLTTDWGKIQFNPAGLPFLANKNVRITFKNQSYVKAPQIKTGSDVLDLDKAKATFNQSGKTINLDENALVNTTIVPGIQIDKPVIETTVEDVEIKGTVSDPTTAVTYSVDDNAALPLVGVDLQTGVFTIPINIKTGTKQVEITTKYRNGEETSKVVVVRFTNDSDQTTATTTNVPSTISLPINQITIALLLAAVGLLAIIIGIIYYLVKHRKGKDKKAQINLNPVVNKVSSIGNSNENEIVNDKENKVSPSKEKIDLTSLKNKYLNEDNDSKPIVKNEDKALPDEQKEG